MTAAGNRPIWIASWEKDLLQLPQSDENPTFQKVPRAVTAGIKPAYSKPVKNCASEDEYADDPDVVEPCML